MAVPYSVYVHLFEVRNLQGVGSTNMSDPYANVLFKGLQQQTEITRDAVNVVWDQTFVFEDVMLTQDEFERENIVIQIFDANVFVRNKLIGQYSFGVEKTWSQPIPIHQFYKKWVLIADPSEPEKIQGYLKCSVTVLGPGDRAPSHALEDEAEKSSSDWLLKSPPIGKRMGYHLDVRVFRGEGLVPVGGDTFSGFVSIKFNSTVMRTGVASETSSPVWDTLLRLPVFIPILTDNIDMQIWDFKKGAPDELLSTVRWSFTDILSDSVPPTWVNVYSVPEDEVGRAGGGDFTLYMGRILVGLSASSSEMPVMVEKGTPGAPVPMTQPYALHFDLYRGSEIPCSGSVVVEVSFGPASRWTKPASINSKGEFEFECEPEHAAGDDGEDEAESAPGQAQFKSFDVYLPVMASDSPPLVHSMLYDIIINVRSGRFVGWSWFLLRKYVALPFTVIATALCVFPLCVHRI